jgi:hypothetical protein
MKPNRTSKREFRSPLALFSLQLLPFILVLPVAVAGGRSVYHPPQQWRLPVAMGLPPLLLLLLLRGKKKEESRPQVALRVPVALYSTAPSCPWCARHANAIARGRHARQVFDETPAGAGANQPPCLFGGGAALCAPPVLPVLFR